MANRLVENPPPSHKGLTEFYLKSALVYDLKSGFFLWKYRPNKSPQWNGKFAGKKAGTVNCNGYIVICIDGRDFFAHNLAWLYVMGESPWEGDNHLIVNVDHRNCIKSDNKFINLRRLTHAENGLNTKNIPKGVYFCKITKKWRSRIRFRGNKIELGRFDTYREAREVYDNRRGQVLALLQAD